MTTRDRLPKAHAYHLPPLTAIVESKHAHELLEMIVEHGVVHARIDVVERLGDDRVAREDVQRDARRREEGRRVHAQPAKVADHEATEFVGRREGEARDGVLRMRLESDAVSHHRRQERGEEKAHESAGCAVSSTSQPASALPPRAAGLPVRRSLVQPPDALLLRIQLKHPHDAGCDAIRARMTTLDEARADDKAFSAGLATVLVALTHDRPAMLRYFAVRLDVTDARQLPRDGEQRWIKVQGRHDLRGEARAHVHARWRDRANRRRQLDADSELEMRIRQDVGKYHRPERNR
jgi:hypothetical protein